MCASRANVSCDAFLATYAAAVSSERLPAPVAARVVEVVRPTRSVTQLNDAVDAVRSLAPIEPTRFARRFLFLWLRVFVRETKRNKVERVNVRIPIPIPVIGAFLPLRLSRTKALKAVALAEMSDEPAAEVSDYLDSVMGFEFVRVDERKGDDHRSLVVVGFD